VTISPVDGTGVVRLYAPCHSMAGNRPCAGASRRSRAKSGCIPGRRRAIVTAC
jgi:hypothetical protein